MAPDTLTIDGVGPMPVERPASVAELGEVVRRCAADGTAVYHVGGGTMLDYGTPPARPGVALSTGKLDQVIDFPARDMTITVQAGITIAKLQEITKAEGLWLPIDVPEPDRATLGGAIACNVSGPRRYGYGTFRDYVIGISLVNDRGEETKAGGRVVKNVAGYDLMKLYTGALGTLGVITQVTLKLRPVPEERALVVFADDDIDRLGDTFDRLHRSETRPAAIDISCLPGGTIDGRAKPSHGGFAVFVLFEGNREAVAWQTEQVQREVPDTVGRNLAPADRVYESIAAETQKFRTPASDNWVIFRAALRPSGLVEFCRRAMGEGAVGLYGPAGAGVICGYVGGTGLRVEGAQRVLQAVAHAAAAHDGNVIVEVCPTDWKKTLPVWGRPPADLALQKAVKRALDPKGIFNPGRFVTDQ
jgi:glycolate oxidase FAD binding subunit